MVAISFRSSIFLPRCGWWLFSLSASSVGTLLVLPAASGFLLPHRDDGLRSGCRRGAGRSPLVPSKHGWGAVSPKPLLPANGGRPAGPADGLVMSRGRSRPSASSSTSTSTAASVTTTDPAAEPSQQQRSPQQGGAEGPGRWDSFDYLQHWYPVGWQIDLPVGAPTKQTLFDQDYAVVVTPHNQVLAFVDKCPHRSAALSEGRLTNSGRHLQCAYHGWSFDADGTCVDIPQSSSSGTQSYSPRACAVSVPAVLHQGMVWLWPGPMPPSKLPPTVPELDDPAFKVLRLVRDFPIIDWSILLSNIMDPDHGMFAHQLTSFDLYSGSKEHPMQVAEEFEQHGWTMTSRVRAVEKVKLRDRLRRGSDPSSSQKKKTPAQQQQQPPRTATTTFIAPAVVTMCRRDDKNDTSFLSIFWVSPTGTGRSRFLTATAARAPFALPRWFQHVFLNAFLDQDSLLVASQQPHTLSAEILRYENETTAAPSSLSPSRGIGDGARRGTYVYQSPSDRMVRLVDAFFDATLARAPNRVQRLREMKAGGDLRRYPPREVVLDLEAQHLRVCPDSRDAVRNCKRIVASSSLATAVWCFLRASGRIAMLPTPVRSVSWPVTMALLGWAANFFQKGFYYGYTVEKQRRDLAKIPIKSWADPVCTT